jgi:hypothetical protein
LGQGDAAAADVHMLRRFPQGMRDRLLMNAVGLKPGAFADDLASAQ